KRQVSLRSVLGPWQPDHFVRPIDIGPLHVEHFAQSATAVKRDHEDSFQASWQSFEDTGVIVIFKEALPRVFYGHGGNVGNLPDPGRGLDAFQLQSSADVGDVIVYG